MPIVSTTLNLSVEGYFFSLSSFRGIRITFPFREVVALKARGDLQDTCGSPEEERSPRAFKARLKSLSGNSKIRSENFDKLHHLVEIND